MACCLLIAALFTRVNEWLHRHGLVGTNRTVLFPTASSPIPAAQGGPR
ncbi:hypothetical protein JDM601_3821 [Mycolicibacter sinensis]|uniref:Uncharacterized protein n=1 Tax=Mycolicibacter sinensis (strain JDM601) TaxID=875328 RepID=F5YRN0_MYCSD|nr:hypothetical protein JDM601_3821 [Mycolicibacter sinensis]